MHSGDVPLSAHPLLAKLRGKAMSFNLSHEDSLPSPILAIDDPLLRQHALEAWTAASKFAAIISYWELFLIAHKLQVTISDENQYTVTSVFPELSSMKDVLQHLANLSLLGFEESPFPVQAFMDLIMTIHNLIKRYAWTLVQIGVGSDAFSPSDKPLWENDETIFIEPVDFRKSPPVVRLKGKIHPNLKNLQAAAQGLKCLLEVASATALKIPKAGKAPGQARLEANVRQSTFRVDNDIYTLKLAEVAFLDALLKRAFAIDLACMIWA